MTLYPVPPGDLAAVVTYLEMTKPPPGDHPRGTLRLSRVVKPRPDHYRALFRKVGSPWLWFSRLVMDDPTLESIIGDPAVELYEVAAVEAVVGMLELDFREPGRCEEERGTDEIENAHAGKMKKALPGFGREGLSKGRTAAYCAARVKLASAVAPSATVTFISFVPRRSCHTSTV